jgi:DNA-directed RNA polymerase specialized sigma24 family protein
LEGIGYDFRGRRWGFFDSILKSERGFFMNRELTQTLRGLGDALIKTYFHEWLPEKKRIDRYLENMVLNSPILRMDKVQGGDHIPPQERLQEIKDEHKGYQTLSRNIERMEAFLDGLSDDERALISLHYCQGLEFGEISLKFKKERGDVMKNFSSIQKRLGAFWVGESEVRNARA